MLEGRWNRAQTRNRLPDPPFNVPHRPHELQLACQALVTQLRESFAVLRARLEQFLALENQRKQLGGGR